MNTRLYTYKLHKGIVISNRIETNVPMRQAHAAIRHDESANSLSTGVRPAGRVAIILGSFGEPFTTLPQIAIPSQFAEPTCMESSSGKEHTKSCQ